MQTLLRILLIALAVNATAACSLMRDRRDAPWDRRGQVMFDQIPNWEGGANRVCGGHLDEATRVREGRSARC